MVTEGIGPGADPAADPGWAPMIVSVKEGDEGDGGILALTQGVLAIMVVGLATGTETLGAATVGAEYQGVLGSMSVLVQSSSVSVQEGAEGGEMPELLHGVVMIRVGLTTGAIAVGLGKD